MISLHGRPVPGFALGDVAPMEEYPNGDPYAKLDADLWQMRLDAVKANTLADYQANGQRAAEAFGPAIDNIGPSAVTQPFTHDAWSLNAKLAAATDAVQAKTLLDLMLNDYQQAIVAGRRSAKQKEPSRWSVFLIPLGALVLIGGVWYLAK